MIILLRDEYVFRVEFPCLGVILHGDVFCRWGRGVRDRVRRDARLIAEAFSPTPVYAFHTENQGPTQLKFVKTIGGVWDHTRYKSDGEKMDFYRFHPLRPI